MLAEHRDSISRSGSCARTDRFARCAASACLRPWWVCGTGIDVTEQEELTKALRKTEEEFGRCWISLPRSSGSWGPGASDCMQPRCARLLRRHHRGMVPEKL